ncbi:GNAT family N-acetyltransferase [Acidisoma sp. 7E03]
MTSTIVISDLRQCPSFLDVVADRLWHAWWHDSSYDLPNFRLLVAQALEDGPLPRVFVAHEQGRFLGTASAIRDDLDLRPQYQPWVAGVWVEEAARSRGLGRLLVGRAAEAIFAAGFPRAYLYAGAHRVSFYTGLGWQVLEEGVGPEQVTVFVLPAPG